MRRLSLAQALENTLQVIFLEALTRMWRSVRYSYEMIIMIRTSVMVVIRYMSHLKL